MKRKDNLTALDLGRPRDRRLDPDNAAYFAKCEEKLGFVPNVLAAYAFDNVKLRAFILMADDLMLGDSGLSKAEREMIAVAVSAVNHCHYCLTSHGAALRQRAADPELGETIAQNWRAAGLEPRYRRAFWLVSALTAFNMYIFYGFGDGSPPLLGRTWTGVDLTVLVSLAGIGSFPRGRRSFPQVRP